MTITKICNFVVDNDVYCDRIPIVSTLANLYYLFQKFVIAQFKIDKVTRSFNAEYISHKSYFRCLVLLVPVLGNIAVYLYEKMSVKTLIPYHSYDTKVVFPEQELPTPQEVESNKKIYEICVERSSLCEEVSVDNVLNILIMAHQNSQHKLVNYCTYYIKKRGIKDEDLWKGLEFSLNNDLSWLSRVLLTTLFVKFVSNWCYEDKREYHKRMRLCLSNQIKRKLWDFADRNHLNIIKALMDPDVFEKGVNIFNVKYKRAFFDLSIHSLVYKDQIDNILPRNNVLAKFISLKATMSSYYSSQCLEKFFNRIQSFNSLTINNQYRIYPEEARAFKEGLKQLKSLRSLTLNEFPTNIIVDWIKDIENLNSFVLDHFDGDFKAFLSVVQEKRPWKKLGILGWYSNGPKISPDDVTQLLTALEQNTTLTKLILHNQGIDVQGAISLADFIAKKPQLASLNLNYNPLKAEGIKCLGLENNTTLRKISLTVHNQEELQAIANIIEQNKSLKTLVLNFDYFQEGMWDELLKALSKNNTLKYLNFHLTDNYIRNTSFPSEGKFLVNLVGQVNSLKSIITNYRLNSKDATALASSLEQNHVIVILKDARAREVLNHAKKTVAATS